MHHDGFGLKLTDGQDLSFISALLSNDMCSVGPSDVLLLVYSSSSYQCSRLNHQYSYLFHHRD